MKKIILSIVIVVFCFLVTGCKNKEEEVVINWKTSITSAKVPIEQEALQAYENALEEDDNYEVVALLGKQLVAGTNYMFLVVEDQIRYKVITVYKDLENHSTIIQKSNLEYLKYANENIDQKRETMVAGWEVEFPSEGAILEEKVQEILNTGLSRIEGVKFIPIAVVGTQEKDGMSYALLCYGTVDTTSSDKGIYLLTLHEDLDQTQKIVSSAYINLASFA